MSMIGYIVRKRDGATTELGRGAVDLAQFENDDYCTHEHGWAAAPLQWPATEQALQAVCVSLQLTNPHVPPEHVIVVQVSVEQLLPSFELSAMEAQLPLPTLVVELPPHAAFWHAAGVVPGQVGWDAVFPSVSICNVNAVTP